VATLGFALFPFEESYGSLPTQDSPVCAGARGHDGDPGFATRPKRFSHALGMDTDSICHQALLGKQGGREVGRCWGWALLREGLALVFHGAANLSNGGN
jgi:hypothetical protein